MTDAQKYCMADEELTRGRVEALASEMKTCKTLAHYYELAQRHFWVMTAVYHGAPALFDWAKEVLDQANDEAGDRLS
ncbi:hypothetical protein LO767_07435 [Halopseudomonas aestusnigri]|uniref:hypothetical protein n=1 Tax=Halopseudomonas aestusnigri TaxID=857252 RepID=UPI001E350FD0|nr:hypothetical protein [Halopseudomonas aestusnigri]UGV32299.1 hypothetical protein LO767_07435 [Halopseudomonas aestusnigri]